MKILSNKNDVTKKKMAFKMVVSDITMMEIVGLHPDKYSKERSQQLSVLSFSLLTYLLSRR